MTRRYRSGGDEIDALLRDIRSLGERLRRVEVPDSAQRNLTVQTLQEAVTELGETVATVQGLVTDLTERVDEAISTQSYTKAEINQRISNPPTAVAVTGTISATQRATFDAGITSADVRSRQVTTSYVSVYVDGNGVLGYAPSSRRFKTDEAPAELDASSVLGIVPKSFRYIDGDGAPQVGFIAEDLDDAGLTDFVIYDEEGLPAGVRYEMIAVAQQAVIRSLDERLRSLEASRLRTVRHR